MDKLIDKILILICCIFVYSFFFSNSLILIPILVVISISAFMSYTEKELYKQISFLTFIIVCFLYSSYVVFIPIIAYDFLGKIKKPIWILSLVPIIFFINKNSLWLSFLITFILIIAFLNKWRSLSLQKIKNKYIVLRDNTKELNIRLENKNNELLEKQDYEITLATLNERNRIARDIHDNVGHTLSSAILQVGALYAVSKDEKTKQNLETLKTTLVGGMETIRNSIHNLHNDSLSLEFEIKKIVENFKFCDVNFDYDFDSDIPSKIKYIIISIVKEALSNVIKHSNATKVDLKFCAHPAIYQLIINDNGSRIKNNVTDGIGLRSISERVEGLNGVININSEKGFKIFISIPRKEDVD